MTRALAHRGPDGEGFWVEGNVGLGHRRLAIRDLTPLGRQPMADPAGQVFITYNGEIYNDGALRAELARTTGWIFRSRTDTEVILAGWMAWGEALLDRLEGMFAFALWDRRRSELVLVRDPAGIKPLFFAERPGTIVFASEVKGLLSGLDVRPGWVAEHLHVYLAQGYVGPSETLLEGIAQLPPGTIMTFRDGTRHQRRFWQPVRRPDINTLDAATTGFLDVWQATLPMFLASDVPLGILQSGGVDSSLITLALQGQSVPLVFTAGFAEASHDESDLARQIAGVDSHIVQVDTGWDAEQTFRAVVRAVDGQMADSSTYAAYKLFAQLRRHITVALSGDGADEFFAGYETYHASRLAAKLRPLVPRSLAGLSGKFLTEMGGSDETRLSLRQRAARFLLGLGAGGEPHAQWRRILPSFLISDLYGPALRYLTDAPPLAAYAAAVANAGGGDDGVLLADQTYYLPADMLRKVDAASMAHGLEIRVPFLSRAVMELAGRIDARVLYPEGGPPKAPLRKALAILGAPETVTTAPKRGFNLPVDRMLRGPLAPLGHRLLDERADSLLPWFNPDTVRRLWREHRDRQRSWGYVLWAVLSLAVWAEESS